MVKASTEDSMKFYEKTKNVEDRVNVTTVIVIRAYAIAKKTSRNVT